MLLGVPALLPAVTATLATISGADWFIIVSMVLGSAGIAGIITALVGVAKYRTDVQQQRVVSAAQMRTVAAEEAEAAMRIMGETVDRANAETRRIAAQVEVMRADLDECLEAQRRMKGG